jgi:hypothetical protein
MRSLVIALAAGAIGLSVAAASPARAQVGVEVGVPGVGVEVGTPRHDHYRVERRRRVYRDHDYMVGSCRTITERRERWDGSMETRRVRRCD